MAVTVKCPYCSIPFELVSIPATGRASCPRCSESVPVTAETAHAPSESPAIAVSRPRSVPPLLVISLGLTAAIIAGFTIWWFTQKTAKPQPSTSPIKLTVPPATMPPSGLAGLKYIPRDSQLVLTLQPSPLWQYAERTNQKPEELFATFGIPREALAKLSEAGIKPEQIAHLVLAGQLDSLKAVLVIQLRAPLPDEAAFRKNLKATPAKGDHWSAELGVPVYLKRVDEKTWLFAIQEADLDTPPHSGFENLRTGLRDSFAKLSPASFLALATDSKDWSQQPLVKFIPASVAGADLPKRLKGVQSVSFGFSLEPELKLGVAIRFDDSQRAQAFSEELASRWKEAIRRTTPNNVWAELELPFEPPTEKFRDLKSLFGR